MPVRGLVGRLDGRAPGEKRLERIGMAQRELHAQREAADLRPELAPAAARRLDLRHLAEDTRGITRIDEHRRDHHGPTARGGDLFQPRHGRRAALGEHEHTAPGLAERAGEGQQLARIRES